MFIAQLGCRSFSVLDDGALRGTVDSYAEWAEFIHQPIACSPTCRARRGALNEGMCGEERGRGVFPCPAAWQQSEARCRRRHRFPSWTTSEGQRGIRRYSRARLVSICAEQHRSKRQRRTSSGARIPCFKNRRPIANLCRSTRQKALAGALGVCCFIESLRAAFRARARCGRWRRAR
jgi:hypothetical protein